MKIRGRTKTGVPYPADAAIRESKLKPWQKEGAVVLAIVLLIGIAFGLYDLLGGSRDSVPATSRTSSQSNDSEQTSTIEKGEPGGSAGSVESGSRQSGTSDSENRSPDSSSPREEPSAEPTQTEQPAVTDMMTLEKYDRIETGMTYDEVVEITGSPGLNANDVPSLKPYGMPDGSVSYAFPSNDPSNIYAAAIITFQNDAVIGKYQNGLK